MADFSRKIIFQIPFLSFSNANFEFDAKKFTWRLYTTIDALSTVIRVELINKHEFVEVVVDENSDIFVIYVVVLTAPKSVISTYLLQASLLAHL